MKLLAKITKIEGGAATVDSPEFTLSNHKTLAFLFENAEGTALTVKVKAAVEDGEAVPVRFLFAEAGAYSDEYEEVSAEGKEITEARTYLAVLTDRLLAHDEYDRASVSLSADAGEIATAYALQMDPRYTGNE